MVQDARGSRLATQLVFLVAGFAVACWAPLVPFARQRLGVGDGTLGLLLLCLGAGSVAAMQLAGIVSARYGARPAITAGGLGLCAILPALPVAPTPLTLGAALFLFGAALGSLDAAMNIHAVEVERRARRALMSGFHALFSIGGFAGAGLMTALLSAGTSPFGCTLIGAAIMLAAMTAAIPRLLRAAADASGPLFVAPRGIVLLLAGLAAATFLVEGAMLDWSALLITGAALVAKHAGGLGYMLFAIAMTIGRLFGDAATARLGDRRVLRGGGMIAVLGFAVLLAVPIAPVALSGFVLIGFGAANMVPILFRKAGAQQVMPLPLAVSAVTTVGYAGVLCGPAAIGALAQWFGLPAAFAVLAVLLAVVPAVAGIVTRDRAGGAPTR